MFNFLNCDNSLEFASLFYIYLQVQPNGQNMYNAPEWLSVRSFNYYIIHQECNISYYCYLRVVYPTP